MPSARKLLIVNADDLGYSPGITDGILRAHREGILTSTTLMATMPDRERALELALQTPTLGVGIHLCLTEGKPVGRCGRLIDADKNFERPLLKLARRLLNKTAAAQAEAEWDAQVQWAMDRGLRPTHLDSHKHIHHLPMLQHAIVNVARRYSIPYVRAAREFRVPGTPRMITGYRVLRVLAASTASRLARRHIGTTDRFFGLAATGRMSADVWQLLLDHLPAGTTEVMVHPGYPVGLDPATNRLTTSRQVELDALLDPRMRQAVEANHITLANFATLARPQPT